MTVSWAQRSKDKFGLLQCIPIRSIFCHACTAGRIWKRICPCLNNSFFFFSLLLLMAENNQTYTWKQLVNASSSTKVNLCQYLGLAKYFKSNCHGPEQILVKFYVCTYVCSKRVGGAGENFSRKGLRKVCLSTNAWKGAQTQAQSWCHHTPISPSSSKFPVTLSVQFQF